MAEQMGTTIVSQVAKKPERPTGAPRYSDVSMRLFRKHEGEEELAAAKAFHITRADWSYIMDKEYINRVHAQGWTFQGTTNAVTTDSNFALKDKKDKPVLDHFKKEGRYRADCHNEAYRQWYVSRLKEWVELGVDSLQRDEPTATGLWSISDAAEFLQDVHSKLERETGRKIPISANLAWNSSVFGGKGELVTKLFDFGMAEMGRDKVNAAFLWNASRDARKRGKFLVYTSHQNLGVPAYRRAIAGCYAILARTA